MIVGVIDTHAVIWYLSGDVRLSSTAKVFIESTIQAGDEIAVSAITLVEMVYLIEKGRIPAQRFSHLTSELDNPESIFVPLPVDVNISRALSRVSVA